MEFQIAKRMQGLENQLVQEVLDMAADPNIIAFGGGNPSTDTFPIEAIGEITQKILAENPIPILRYGLSEGYSPLRKTLEGYLSDKWGIGSENDRILIVSGSQQAADLASKCLLEEGDVVVCEDPSFFGCLDTFRSYGARLVGVPMEEDGMDLLKLEEALLSSSKVKMIYTIPTFQNPTGITTSLEKRKRIYELAKKYKVAILEDNPYGELRFKGMDIPTIKSFDTEGLVIYCGSFSKVMAPAFRIGFVVVNKQLFSTMITGKSVTDVHTNTLFQHICHSFMTEYDFDAHLEKCRQIYGQKRETMISELEVQLHPSVTFTRPEGGMFVMVYLPEGVDAVPFVKEAVARGVATIPGSAFSITGDTCTNAFRINFASPSEEQIRKGVGIIGQLTHEWLKEPLLTR